MGFNQEEAYRCVLCMYVTPQQFQFAVLDPDQKKILHSESHAFERFEKDELKTFLKNPLLKNEFAHYSVAAGTERNTLIPTDLFSYSKSVEIFKLNHADPIDNLDYNRIAEHGIVNIFELPLWVKSQFVIAFPRVKVLHKATVLIKGIFDEPSYRPKIHISVEKDEFHLLITDKSKLTFFNRFDYKELADLVYYILFVLEQKEYDQSDFEICLYGVSPDWEELDRFATFFSTKIKLADQPEKGEHFILAKQLLCV